MSRRTQVEKLPNKYHLDKDDFAIIQGEVYKQLPCFYGNNYSVVKEKKTNEKFYMVKIDRVVDKCDFRNRYINFVYIAGNQEPFGYFKGYYIVNETRIPSNDPEKECCLYYKFDPANTLQCLMNEDPDNFLDDTAKSKTLIAIAAVLEYCHALGIQCRFIHPESIFYDKDKNPFVANFGYSDSIFNGSNSTFNRKVINSENSLFTDITNYIQPELLKNPDLKSYSCDVYAFGALLDKILEKYRHDINDEMFINLQNISQNCRENRCTSHEILNNITKLSNPLFKQCNMKKYTDYKKKILNNIYLTEELEPFGDDERALFVNASRKLNQKTDLQPQIKANILQNLIKSAKENYIPAIYKLALFLDSNNDTFIYDINTDVEYYDPFMWMEKAVECGVFKAPLLLSQMYSRRGLCKKSAKILEGRDQKFLIKWSVDDAMEKKISTAVKRFADIHAFENQMNEIYKDYKTGRPHYLLAILYRYGEISEKVLKGNDGLIRMSADDNDTNLIECYSCMSDAKFQTNIQISCRYLYEPAVAEYANFLIERKNELENAIDLINNFFSFHNCTYNCSSVKIQYVYAKICEKNGDLKQALRIYKESADGGYIKSHDEYLRLYKELYKDDANPAIIKYYELRKEPILSKNSTS